MDVIPCLEDLHGGLTAACDDEESEPASIIWVACQAGIEVINKYSTLTEENEIYIISIGKSILFPLLYNLLIASYTVMCPDRKLKWFLDHGRTAAAVAKIKKLVVQRWNSSYSSLSQSGADEPEGSERPRKPKVCYHNSWCKYPANKWQCSKWAVADPTESGHGPDHILTYLKEPPVTRTTIKEAGGYIQYWHKAHATRPSLAKMGCDFCSAPGEHSTTVWYSNASKTYKDLNLATSVDAERAFSAGQCQINFMQHNMNSQTFKAQMAVGSWARSKPLFPGISEVAKINQNRMASTDDDFFEGGSKVDDDM